MAHEVVKLAIVFGIGVAFVIVIWWIGHPAPTPHDDTSKAGTSSAWEILSVSIEHGTLPGCELELRIATPMATRCFGLNAAMALELGRALSIEGARAALPLDPENPRARLVAPRDERTDGRAMLGRAVTCRACGLRWAWNDKGERPTICNACGGDELDTDAELQLSGTTLDRTHLGH